MHCSIDDDDIILDGNFPSLHRLSIICNNVIDEYKNIMKPDAPKGIRVDLEPGDMLVYSGCELEHWREEFTGNICAQVFLHYNHVNGQFADSNLYDKRPLLGLPPFTKK